MRTSKTLLAGLFAAGIIAGCGTAQAQPAPSSSPLPVLELQGPAADKDEWTTARVVLDGGDYELTWGAGPPFRGEFGACGSRFGACQAVVRLVDGTGQWLKGSPDLPDIYIDAPTQGAVVLNRLKHDQYTLEVHVSCPWTVSIRPE